MLRTSSSSDATRYDYLELTAALVGADDGAAGQSVQWFAKDLGNVRIWSFVNNVSEDISFQKISHVLVPATLVLFQSTQSAKDAILHV